MAKRLVQKRQAEIKGVLSQQEYINVSAGSVFLSYFFFQDSAKISPKTFQSRDKEKQRTGNPGTEFKVCDPWMPQLRMNLQIS
jgi:hypothetical protein